MVTYAAQALTLMLVQLKLWAEAEGRIRLAVDLPHRVNYMPPMTYGTTKAPSVS